MPCDTPPLHVTKRVAAKKYNRSERSLSRDLIESLKTNDVDTLVHCQLGIENGTLFPGTELTVERITELRDEGANPLWFLHTNWLGQRYGLRNPVVESVAQADPIAASTAPVSDAVVEDPLPPPRSQPSDASVRDEDPDTIIAILERQITDLKEDKQELREQLKRSDELRRQDNELREQNNVLMQEIYRLLPTLAGTPPPKLAVSEAEYSSVQTKSKQQPVNSPADVVGGDAVPDVEGQMQTVAESEEGIPTSSVEVPKEKPQSEPKPTTKSKSKPKQSASATTKKSTTKRSSSAKSRSKKPVRKKPAATKAETPTSKSAPSRTSLFGFFRRRK